MIPQFILKLNAMEWCPILSHLTRIARTESNSGVRQNRLVLKGRAKAPNEMSSQRELKIFNKSMCILKFSNLNENLLHYSKLHILAEGNFSF